MHVDYDACIRNNIGSRRSCLYIVLSSNLFSFIRAVYLLIPSRRRTLSNYKH